ncbi:BOLA class I histocompatibility antigen, alpha chain BL3-6-like isoform X1 [Pygocentrus nattereri]|uniref:Ig-like domain-containing protein n=1 Tax=Pygocentrus nattereri TaxID=42514 RepID=A0AAR2KUK3_PYGNA|nr:BOLA class I histocompatibility antigen, alpha chain BL3-6-like isoform X1 [Pygocentrus nattereri]
MGHIMKSLLLLIFTRHLASAANHSLQFLLTGITPRINFPDFTAVTQLDGLQIGYYDSNSNEIRKVAWINTVNEDPWNLIMEDARRYQEAFNLSIATVTRRFNHTEGNHTWQWTIGCGLHDDGTKRGYSRYGYDGEDFLSLDLNALTWTAANAKAVTTKREWEKTDKAKGHKKFLENDCMQWLKEFVELGKATLERKVPPEVSLFQKVSSSSVVCHATGFFPKVVNISWQKNGEDLHEDVKLRETLPNQDGTFQKRSVLTVSPEELKRHDYTCIIQHSSLEKEVVLLVSERRVSGGILTGIIVGAVVTALLVIIICVGVFVWMKKKSSDYQPPANFKNSH